MSPGEIAAAQADYAKAEGLLAQEVVAPGADADAVHNAYIRALLAEDKVDQAEKDAADWAAAAPQDVWSAVSLSEVQWREGETLEALAQIASAAAMDGCNARVHADYAHMLDFSGMYGSALKQAELAHMLDPVDDDITVLWITLQPRAQRAPALGQYLASATYLTADQRKAGEEWKQHLSNAGVAPCRLVGEPHAATVELSRRQGGPNRFSDRGLYVTLDGKIRDLELDTGSHGILLSKAAARFLHLVPENTSTASGLGDEGTVKTYLAIVPSVKIGPFEFHNCEVEVVNQWDEALVDRDGLIGADFLSRFLITIDFPAAVVKLDPLPALPAGIGADDGQPRDRYVPPQMADWVRVFRAGHELVLPVQLNGGPFRLFLMDTGAASDSISWTLAKQFTKVRKDIGTEVVGLSGEVKHTFQADKISLLIGGYNETAQNILAVDAKELGTAAGAQIGGTIGADTLHQATVHIDYRDNLAKFDLNPSRLKPCMRLHADIRDDCYNPR